MVDGVALVARPDHTSAVSWDYQFHDGQTVVARIEAMSRRGTALLSMNHRMIEVNTPVELVVGEELRLVIEKGNGLLRLVVQAGSEGAIAGRLDTDVSQQDELVRSALAFTLEHIPGLASTDEARALQTRETVLQAYASASLVSDDAEQSTRPPNGQSPPSEAEPGNQALVYLYLHGQAILRDRVYEGTAGQSKADDRSFGHPCMCGSGLPSYPVTDGSSGIVVLACENCDPTLLAEASDDPAAAGSETK
jgi:hypothetical protein